METDLRTFLARSTDMPFEETELAKVLSELPTLSADGPWIAGGALRRTLQGADPNSDFDFFFRDAEQLNEFARDLTALGLTFVKETEHHRHFRGVIGEGLPRDVQLIRFAYYPNAAAVIDSFDYTICQFAFDGQRLVTSEFALWDLGRRRLAVHKITFPVSSMRRLLKYTRQGFTACKGCLAAILKATIATPELHTQLDIEYVD